MNNLVKISLISYTNTKPFVYGLLRSPALKDRIEVSFDSPADCARKLDAGEVDLGIVPVAALLNRPDYHIISNYCIGAEGKGNSVFLFSQVPFQDITTIYLDKESRTSNNLTRVLCHYLWKIEPRFVSPQNQDDKSLDSSGKDNDSSLKAGEARVLIGDRTFSGREKYKFHYDLSEEWQRLTGLPFVFAVWASTHDLGTTFEQEFNEAMEFGLDHRQEIIQEILIQENHDPNFDYSDYLNHKLSFSLDSLKKEALARYWSYLRELDPQPV